MYICRTKKSGLCQKSFSPLVTQRIDPIPVHGRECYRRVSAETPPDAFGRGGPILPQYFIGEDPFLVFLRLRPSTSSGLRSGPHAVC